MDLTGSVLSAVFSSSCMPFLKALMPCATSPIRSEILPRPKSSRTTAITTIQCQMLSEPILQILQHQIMMQVHHDLTYLFAHDLFGKPVSTFPDHARSQSPGHI